MLRPTTVSLAVVLLVGLAVASVSAAAGKPLPIDDEERSAAMPDIRLSEDATQADDAVVPLYRLANNTKPLSYDVHLHTNVHTQTDFNFTGTVAITIVVLDASVRTIQLHQRRLNIGSVRLSHVDTPNVEIALGAATYVETTNFLTIPLATGSNLAVDQRYVLTISFNGELRNDQAGFYRSSYLADNGSRRWLATTQFESTDARHAFPCYDEPALRAVFRIKITHGSSYTAISNMPVEGTPVVAGDLTTTTFQPTPLTPTYLIAFIVSDFEFVTQLNGRGFVQRVYARPNGIKHGNFAVDTGVKILDAFEKYLGINFQLPKMDQVAVPDFAAGAMENWGLVTYREPYLLFDESRSTFGNKRQITTIIAHEYAHQWFGNLVTPKWWTYLWLNEGFATLFENYATDWVFPEWRILDSYVSGTVQSVMVGDSTNRTRPMTHYVESPAAVSGLFDNVAYAKSGSVLRMFLNAFTEASFKKGLFTHLQNKSESDATEENLFDAIEQAVKADRTLPAEFSVTEIMSSWTRQAGYPLVTVGRSASGAVTLQQKRFYSEEQSSPAASVWWIPINFASSSSANFDDTSASHWLRNASAEITVDGLKPDDWLLVNKRETGYYRVQYDTANYDRLAAALIANRSAIHLVSRAQLLDDAFEFARTGQQSYTVALNLTKYLAEETEYVPWQSAWRAFGLIHRLHSGSASFDKYEKYVRNLISKLFTEAGLVAANNEHFYRKQARIEAIFWACEYGHEVCLANSTAVVGHYLAGHAAIHQDHRAAVLCAGARNATTAQYQQLMQKLVAEVDPDDRLRLIDALACAGSSEHLKAYLETSTGTEPEPRFKTVDERYRAFTQVVSRRAGVPVAIEFLRTSIDDAFQVFGERNINAAFERIAERVNSAELKQKFADLLTVARPKTFITPATYDRVAAIIASNDKWINAHSAEIDQWIREHEHSGASSLIVSSVLLVIMAIVSQMF